MRAQLARWLPRLVALAVVATCAATAVVTLQDRADEVAAEEAALRRTAADARATAAEATRTATLLEELEEVRLAGAADVRAARRDGSVADQVTLLRRLLEAAQAQILDVRQLSDAQREQLDVLRGCVATLDRVRARLAAGDTRGAAGHLAVGQDACARAEEVTDGIVAAVHPFDFPDPDVIEVDGTYYAYGTNGPGGTIQVLASTDLEDWEVRGSALPDVGPWARKGLTWAPAVLRTYDGYLLYYTVRHDAWGVQCLSVARSASPAGPFTDSSARPITCQTDFGGSIDPSPYVGEDGTPYLTWKSEGETIGNQSVLWGARLDRTGGAIVGASIPLLTVDRPWEGGVVEAPTMQRLGGAWILLYSGGDWRTSGYATGYARCLGPLGPCAKPADNLVLQTDDVVEGPGGPSVFRTPDGRPMVAYAGWSPGAVGPPEPRRLHLAELHATADTVTAS
ncbi:glycoside hydrolase family 43 protein [Iamia majanohamensis]|uniref:Glycoside hydrolase family 43 protein n=1 Tax=Iamia majanohamensis TaxID=467976 RepID=A0AAE9Y664_9ACTN|nr:glycoside hydrolase family 43 protein [Iamia majanohamensis]WCO67625.1 glycoside hydrolase family 43 protein [Iamia majanohamensis]